MKRHPSFDYTQFEDFIINKLCADCDKAFNDLDDEVDECPSCGGQLLNETALEDTSCAGCSKTLICGKMEFGNTVKINAFFVMIVSKNCSER